MTDSTDSTSSILTLNHGEVVINRHIPFLFQKSFSRVGLIFFRIKSAKLIRVPLTPNAGLCLIICSRVCRLTWLTNPAKSRLNTIELLSWLDGFAMWAVLCLHLTIVACGTVPIKDEIFYGNKGMLGAVEFHTFTTDKRVLTFEQWMTLIKTKPLICSSVDTFGDAKKFYEQVCSVCNCCAPETTAKAEEFFENIKSAQATPLPANGKQ